jgi:DNA-binding transcriptional regulator YiaG
MTTKQYRAALKTLGLSQRGFARIIGMGERSSRRWALDEARVPDPVAILLRLMLDGKISAADVQTAAHT